MLYTVGIRRRFGLGWKKHKVVGHSWKEMRLILEFQDGSQIHVPGFKVKAFKVYPDLKAAIEADKRKMEKHHWDEFHKQREREKEAHYIAELKSKAESIYRPIPTQVHGPETDKENHLPQERGPQTLLEQAQESAHARVRGILQGGG